MQPFEPFALCSAACVSHLSRRDVILAVGYLVGQAVMAYGCFSVSCLDNHDNSCFNENEPLRCNTAALLGEIYMS